MQFAYPCQFPEFWTGRPDPGDLRRSPRARSEGRDRGVISG